MSDIDHHLLDRGNVDVAVVMVELIMLRNRDGVRRDGIGMSIIRMMCVDLLRSMLLNKDHWNLIRGWLCSNPYWVELFLEDFGTSTYFFDEIMMALDGIIHYGC